MGDLAMLKRSCVGVPALFLGWLVGAAALHRHGTRRHLQYEARYLFAKNLYRPVFAPAMTDNQVAKLARSMVIGRPESACVAPCYSSTIARIAAR